LKRRGVRFAWIRTEDAVYDKAAVVMEGKSGIVVEFPRSAGKEWKIRKESIPYGRIERIRYYR
jgi:hypothetical protein